MKRKSLVLLIVLALIPALLIGCSKRETGSLLKMEEGLKIIATTFAPYDFAKQVVGDEGDVTMLIPPGAESHSFEPTPQDIIKIQNCDVFIYGGGESDEWVTDILASVGSEKMRIVKMTDCVELVEEEIVEGMEHEEEAHEHEENEKHETAEAHEEEIEYDEHVWTSPKNAIRIVEAIEKAVSSADPVHEAEYTTNSTAYIEKLQELDKAFQDVVDHAKRKEVIFADRFPLRYFVEAYGLQYYAAFPGCSTETEPSAATVAFLIDKVKKDQIPAVFHIEMSNEKMADTICEATGAKKLAFNACHNVSKEDFKNGATYLDIMKDNVETLKEALN